LQGEAITLPLDDVVPTLITGATAAGTVVGRFATEPLQLDPQFNEALVKIADDKPRFGFSGGLTLEGANWVADDLTVTQGEHVATVSVARRDNRWSGAVRAEFLDGAKVFSDLKTLRAWWSGVGDATEAPEAV